MNDLYYDIELLRILVVETFKYNKIISFPQTLDFSESNIGKNLKNRALKVYNSHKNIVMCAREERSFEKMKDLYPKIDIRLFPDIVFSLNKTEPKSERKNCLFCFRNDLEKKDNSGFKKSIYEYVKINKIPTVEYDTHIGRGVNSYEREKDLDNIWNAFKKSRFVVTDRLHGMIFAFITGTPAIILDNNNFKITQSYKWIKDCKYIYLANDINNFNIPEIITQIEENKDYKINNNFIYDTILL